MGSDLLDELEQQARDANVDEIKVKINPDRAGGQFLANHGFVSVGKVDPDDEYNVHTMVKQIK